MPSFNRIILAGNLTRDPRHERDRQDIVGFGLAVNRKFNSSDGDAREEVCFVDVVVFGKLAEIVHQHLRRGSSVLIEGRLRFDSWQGRDGSKKSKHCVVAEIVQFLDARGTGAAETAAADHDQADPPVPAVPPRSAPNTPRRSAAPQRSSFREQVIEKSKAAAAVSPFSDDEQVFKDEDIPF